MLLLRGPGLGLRGAEGHTNCRALGFWALRPVWGRLGLREGGGAGLAGSGGWRPLVNLFQDNGQQRAGGPGLGCGVASLRTKPPDFRGVLLCFLGVGTGAAKCSWVVGGAAGGEAQPQCARRRPRGALVSALHPCVPCPRQDVNEKEGPWAEPGAARGSAWCWCGRLRPPRPLPAVLRTGRAGRKEAEGWVLCVCVFSPGLWGPWAGPVLWLRAPRLPG